MGIFKKRYLFLINSVLILSCVISYFILPWAKLLCSLIAICAFMICCIVYLARRKDKVKSIIAALCCMSVFVATFSSFIFFDVYCKNQKTYAGQNLTVKATVLSEEYVGKNISGYDVLVTGIRAEDIDSVRFRARLDCMYISELKPGDVFYADVFADLFESDINGYNMRLDKLGEGMCLSLTSYQESDYVIIYENKNNLNVLLKNLNFNCAFRLRELIGDEEGSLASALLLGNKEHLSDESIRDFSRAGVSHILALSGLHTSILMGAIAFCLKKLRVRRVPRTVLLIILSLAYLSLTGFAISTTRCVIMLLCVYISMILCYLPDSLTSLSVSGALILTFSPGAVIDAGFWMSFAATFGIIVFAPTFDEATKKLFDKWKRALILKRATKYLLTLFATCIFALLGLIIVLCIFTREYSKYSVISSVVLSLPTAAVITLSALLPIFAHVPIINDGILYLTRKSAGFMLDFCADVSEKKSITFLFNFDFIEYFIIFLVVLTFIALCIEFKKKWISVLIISFAVALLCVNVIVCQNKMNDKVKMTYMNISSQSDIIVLSKDGESFICDLSNGSKNSLSAAVSTLKNDNSSEIRAIMLTSYSTYHIASTSKLFKGSIIREIWLPHPCDGDEYYIMSSIIKNAELQGVRVKIYSDFETLKAFGNIDISVKNVYIERSSVPITLVNIQNEHSKTVYVSSAYGELDDECVLNSVNTADNLIIGARGPKTDKYYGVSPDNSLDELIICDIDRGIYFDTNSIDNDIPIYIGTDREIFLN